MPDRIPIVGELVENDEPKLPPEEREVERARALEAFRQQKAPPAEAEGARATGGEENAGL